jgi:pyridoxine 5-phosphate synthase
MHVPTARLAQVTNASRIVASLGVHRGGIMSHTKGKPASNAQSIDPVISVSIGHAITADAPEFGMAETARLFRIACGSLR